ncbi:hypothetical protein QJQ45_018509 [Haematococcus lacustris]|nr:hypothetical protein QJQ45_018509 [Haematococcus lacustris]
MQLTPLAPLVLPVHGLRQLITCLPAALLVSRSHAYKAHQAEQAAESTQPTKGKCKGKGKAAQTTPLPPQPGRWVDQDCDAALNMQHNFEHAAHWGEQVAPAGAVLVAGLPQLPAKGKEYPGLGYKQQRDRPPKAQQQQPATAQLVVHCTLTAFIPPTAIITAACPNTHPCVNRSHYHTQIAFLAFTVPLLMFISYSEDFPGLNPINPEHYLKIAKKAYKTLAANNMKVSVKDMLLGEHFEGSFEGVKAAPPIGKEYQQGFKLVNDRLPKGRQ